MSPGSRPNGLPEYWDIIQVDAGSFLSLHPGYASGLYHDTIRPNVLRDAVNAFRAIMGGGVRILQIFVRSFTRRNPKDTLPQQPFLLLLTFGGTKYASEEREVVEACQRRELAVRTAYVDSWLEEENHRGPLSCDVDLTAGDCLGVLAAWLWQVLRGLRWVFSLDAKQRSLFVASISAIRQHHISRAFARRIIRNHGLPSLVLTLAPWTAPSVTVCEHMKRSGVVTAGIRTQAVWPEATNVAINTDILFCKSPMERQTYETLVPEEGPRFEDGCLLSLPEAYRLEPLCLPERYVLALATNRLHDQDEQDWLADREKLIQVAAAAGLPVVWKEHHPEKGLEEGPVGNGRDSNGICLRVSDIRRNRELIDGASLILSTPSTLLYYAILREKPAVIVETYSSSLLPDEFLNAPIRRIARDEEPGQAPLDWTTLQTSASAALEWFEMNYCLEKGADYLVDFLVSEAKQPGRSPSAQSQQETDESCISC